MFTAIASLAVLMVVVLAGCVAGYAVSQMTDSDE